MYKEFDEEKLERLVYSVGILLALVSGTAMILISSFHG